MASAGSVGLALMAAVLAMLVLPSSGHCLSPSPGPAQAPPLPAPSPPSAPAPAPAPWDPPCSESRRHHCYSVTYPACYSACRASSKCTECEQYVALCGKCKAAEKDKCTANCPGGGCDCDGAAQSACGNDCDAQACNRCAYGKDKQCHMGCWGECSKC
ncbi:hypothetical protein VPH35_069744 [Triticum aestivum]